MIRVMVVVALSMTLRAQDADRNIEQLAREGWLAVRALAPIGAPRDRLGPVNRVLERLDALIVNLPARYADAALRAGLSAAQEEHEEMALFLAHARDLSNQMVLTGAVAQWPLPIDELEGELWFEVDHLAAARDAYRRATTVTGSPRAWLGLARVSDRLRDTAGACAAYQAIAAAAALTRDESTEVAVYLLRCKK